MKYLAVICVLAATVSMASAATGTVTYDVVYGGGSFDVYATVVPGNGGLSFFYLKFGENTTSLNNSAPTAAAWDGSNISTMKMMGFSQAQCPTSSFPNDLSGGQNPSLDPVFMVYGVGQLPGPATWQPLPGGYVYMGGTPAPIGAPVLLGDGTYTGEAPTVLEWAANVFVNDAGTDAMAVDSEVNIIPEPATMSLLVLGGLGVLLRRKQRR